MTVVLTDMTNKGLRGYGSIYNITIAQCVRTRIQLENGTYVVES